MKYTLHLIFVSLLILLGLTLIVNKIFAACAAPTQCGCPAGQCCGYAVGGGALYINAGTTTGNCRVVCTCGRSAPSHCLDNPYLQCSEAQGCYDCERICDLPTSDHTICSEVLWDTCCSPGCDSSRYNCAAPTVIPQATPLMLAPTAPPVSGNSTTEGGSTPPPIPLPTPIPPVNPTCGNGECTGFETCSDCPTDCGACLLAGANSWWQAQGGHVFAAANSGNAMRSLIYDNLCLAPSCIAQLILSQQGSDNLSEGLALTGGGAVTGMNTINTRQQSALGTELTRYKETYSFFYPKSGLGQHPPDDFLGAADNAHKPSQTKHAYFHSGDLTIQSDWHVGIGETLVIFVDGNLILTDPTGVAALITVEQGGFLAFIVSGDITIAPSVGNTTLTVTTPNLEGVFIADGTIRTQSQATDKRFVGAGTFVGWTGVELERDLGAANPTLPAELFMYRADFVKNVPNIMKHPHMIWQETK